MVAVCDSLRSVLFVVVIFERSRERAKREDQGRERRERIEGESEEKKKMLEEREDRVVRETGEWQSCCYDTKIQSSMKLSRQCLVLRRAKRRASTHMVVKARNDCSVA